MSTDSARLLSMWQRLSRFPGGRALFAYLLGRMVPYSGSVGPRVLNLEPGYARIAIVERRRIRNHLNSVHAIAIANVAELASGLAMTSALPANVRGIVVKLEVDYLKKARGRLVAESRCSVPGIEAGIEYVAEANVIDETGESVARARVRWLLRKRDGDGRTPV